RHRTEQPVCIDGEPTAIVLVADEASVVTEDVAPVEVGTGERPVVLAPHRVPTYAPCHAQTEAVIAAEEKRQAGQCRLWPARQGTGPQPRCEVTTRRVTGDRVLVCLALVRHEPPPALLPATLPVAGVPREDRQAAARIHEALDLVPLRPAPVLAVPD